MMDYLIKSNPHHCRLGTGEPLMGEVPTVDQHLSYQYGLDLPHVLRHARGEMDIILPSDQSLCQGDMLLNEYEKQFMIVEIVERRKARGNWQNNPFDAEPDFVRVKII